MGICIRIEKSLQDDIPRQFCVSRSGLLGVRTSQEEVQDGLKSCRPPDCIAAGLLTSALICIR